MTSCDVCGKEMASGYVVHDVERYCSVDCLTKKYTPKEYYEMYEADEAYWTEREGADHWHTDGLPPECKDVELTIDEDGKRRVVMTKMIDVNGKPYWAGYGKDLKVIAWRIPEPYMGD